MIGSIELKQPTPQQNFQPVTEVEHSGTKQVGNRYFNEKCGVSIELPKGWTAIESDFVFEDKSKTLADFQSQDEDIFSLYIAIQDFGTSSMTPTGIFESLREFASLSPDSNIIESDIGQINGFPSYKIVYTGGVPGKYEFHTLEILITAYDREYRLIFEAADKLEFDKYRSKVEEMAKTIKINEPRFDGISC